MGTVLSAQVETFAPADPSFGFAGAWEWVARWDLGKDYTAMLALNDVAEQGWPGDADIRDLADADILERRQWISAELLCKLEDRGHKWWLSMLASLKPLIREGGRARVLFWRD